MYEVLFKTRHGSHLYGLNHADSDEDWYTVVDRPRGRRYKWAKQSIVDGQDSMRVDLPTWLRLCAKGVPQALEAMFAPEPEIDKLSELRYAYRAVGPEVRRTYHRTIDNFLKSDDFKRCRHALRLSLNLRSLRKTGRFSPVLLSHEKKWMSTMAAGLDEEDLRWLAFATAYQIY